VRGDHELDVHVGGAAGDTEERLVRVVEVRDGTPLRIRLPADVTRELPVHRDHGEGREHRGERLDVKPVRLEPEARTAARERAGHLS
jgi:hypothetical protein